jgi:hypothetical protein
VSRPGNATEQHRAEVTRLAANLDWHALGAVHLRDKMGRLAQQITDALGEDSQEARDAHALIALARERMDEAAGFLELAKIPVNAIMTKLGRPRES